jgi:hypothetical protein
MRDSLGDFFAAGGKYRAGPPSKYATGSAGQKAVHEPDYCAESRVAANGTRLAHPPPNPAVTLVGGIRPFRKNPGGTNVKKNS